MKSLSTLSRLFVVVRYRPYTIQLLIVSIDNPYSNMKSSMAIFRHRLTTEGGFTLTSQRNKPKGDSAHPKSRNMGCLFHNT